MMAAMNPPWVLPLVVVGVAALLLLNGKDVSSLSSSLRKSGLAISWLKRLNTDELSKIHEKCSPTNASPPPNSLLNTSSDRIRGGKYASVGQFPHAAALIEMDKRVEGEYIAFCGASLISRRHLLTAAHCVKDALRYDLSDSSSLDGSFRVAVGGVCLTKSDHRVERCPEGDMFEARIEMLVKEFFTYTAADAGSYQRQERDIALLQLREPLPESLFASASGQPAKAGIACLPSPDAPVSELLTLAGWGEGYHSTEPPIRHLRYVQGSQNDTTFAPVNDATYCDNQSSHGLGALPPTHLCIYSVDTAWSRKLASSGDTGGGMVASRGLSPLYTLNGVYAIIAKIVRDYGPRYYDVGMNVAYHLGDMCHYLSLCVGEDARRPVPMLRLSSAYISARRSELPPIEPFRIISDADNTRHQDYCNTLLGLSKPPAFKWVGAVTIDQGEGLLNCTATLITTSHFITTRNCLLDHLKSVATTALEAAITIRMVIETEGDEMLTLQPEFIAWTHHSVGYQASTRSRNGSLVSITPPPPDSELAIGQLGQGDANRLQGLSGGAYVVKPACLETRLNPDGYGVPYPILPAIDYGWLGGGNAVDQAIQVRMKGKLGNQSDGMPSDILFGESLSGRQRHFGDGLVDQRAYRLLALLVGDESSKNGTLPPLRYMHLWDYEGVFCTFLNLNCKQPSMHSNASYLDNRVAFFDRFIYPQ